MRLWLPREFVNHYFGSKAGYPFASQRRSQRTGVTHSGPLQMHTGRTGRVEAGPPIHREPSIVGSSTLVISSEKFTRRDENRASGKRCEMDKARRVSDGNRESNISKCYYNEPALLGDNLAWLRNTKEFPDASPPPAIPAFLSNIAGMSRVIEIRR